MAAPNPGYPDDDRGSHLAATYIAGCAISFVFVAMRLCARFSIAGVGVDDWCMLVTWIVFLPLTILLSILCFDGGTRHFVYLMQNPEHAEYAIKMNWIAQPLAIFCLGTGKIAVALLILRLLNRASVWRRWSLYIASAWTMVNTIVMIILTFVQCTNPAALWDDKISQTMTCWDPRIQSSFSIYGAAVHAAMDFFLAMLPITLVWGLKTDLRKRLALCGLLGCGGLTGICAAIKTSKLIALNERSDFTWETVPLFMWTGIEIILLIICGSIPALKPVYALCIGRRSMPGSTGHRTPTLLKPSAARRTYVRQHSNSPSDHSFVLSGVERPSAAVVSRASEEDLDFHFDLEKSENRIHVTQTVAIS